MNRDENMAALREFQNNLKIFYEKMKHLDGDEFDFSSFQTTVKMMTYVIKEEE